jgi:hypothetical protein
MTDLALEQILQSITTDASVDVLCARWPGAGWRWIRPSTDGAPQ